MGWGWKDVLFPRCTALHSRVKQWVVGWFLFVWWGFFIIIIFLGPFDLPFFLPFSTSTSFPLPPLAEEQETRLSSVS